MYYFLYKSCIWFFCCFLSATIIARESKRQRQQNSDAIREIVLQTHLAYRESLRQSPKERIEPHVKKARAAFDRIQNKIKVKSARDNLAKLLDQLQNEVTNSKDLAEIENKIFDLTLSFFPASKAPSLSPDYQLGQKIYASHCQTCHGKSGHPESALATKFDPPPLSFSDKIYDKNLNPFHIVNALVIGIDGTAKNSFRYSLSLHEQWSVAFYIMAKRQKSEKCKLKDCQFKVELDLHELSLMTDEQIQKTCEKQFQNSQECLIYARKTLAFDKNILRSQ